MIGLTGSQIESLLRYEPETGHFYWKKSGGIAGSRDNKGYNRIKIAGRSYKSHRIAWAYMYGKWPTIDLDHINGDPSDNRIANLRLATRSQNLGNRGSTKLNKSGHKGVRWHSGSRKWFAEIKIAGKSAYLGAFDDPKQAHAAYCEAARGLFGEFARFA